MTTLATSLASFDLAAPFAYESAEERSMQDDFDFDAREDEISREDEEFYCEWILSDRLRYEESEWDHYAFMIDNFEMARREWDF